MAKDIQILYEEIGKRIVVMRELKEMTQAQIGKKLYPPVSRACISAIERGKNRVMVHHLEQIARIFKIPISYFFTGRMP